MLQHHDLIHRGTMRQLESDENPWRPMIAFRGAIRVSEDSASNDVAGGVSHSHHFLGAALAAHPSAQLSRTEVADPASLAQIIKTSTSEARRISAAYQLGIAAAAGNGSRNCPMDHLLALFAHNYERCRRAATQGLRVAAAQALPALLKIISRPHSVALESDQCNVDRRQAVLVSAVHLLSCAGDATVKDEVVRVLFATIDRATKEIGKVEVRRSEAQRRADEELLGNLWPPSELNFTVIERRRTLAECAVALGRIGNRAMRADSSALALQVCRDLLYSLSLITCVAECRKLAFKFCTHAVSCC